MKQPWLFCILGLVLLLASCGRSSSVGNIVSVPSPDGRWIVDQTIQAGANSDTLRLVDFLRRKEDTGPGITILELSVPARAEASVPTPIVTWQGSSHLAITADGRPSLKKLIVKYADVNILFAYGLAHPTASVGFL